MFVTSRGRTMMMFFPAELPPFLQHKVVPQRCFDFLSHTSMMETFALFPRLSICFHVFISFSICFHVAMFPDYRDLELFRRLSTVATSAVQGIGRVRKSNPFEKQMQKSRSNGQCQWICTTGSWWPGTSKCQIQSSGLKKIIEDDVSGAAKLAIDIEEANRKHLQNDAKTIFWYVIQT